MTTQTPEERAETLVTVGSKTPGGPLFVHLRGTSAEAVPIGPFENPDLARGDAAKLRRFLAAVIRETGEWGTVG